MSFFADKVTLGSMSMRSVSISDSAKTLRWCLERRPVNALMTLSRSS